MRLWADEDALSAKENLTSHQLDITTLLKTQRGSESQSKESSMSKTPLDSFRIKAKLLQKAKKKSGTNILLKDAYAILAKASGFSSWQDLKATLEVNQIFCPRGHSAIWKNWYASYEEALLEVRTGKKFLLPYQKEFFVCDTHYIEFLGLQSDDTDLLKVGNNWVQPNDMQAFERMVKKIASRK